MPKTKNILPRFRFFEFMKWLAVSRALNTNRPGSFHGHGLAGASSPVILRPYQQACLEACQAALKAGTTRIGVSLPTGAGKTTVFTSLLSRIVPQSPAASRSLIIVNSIELARQAAAQAITLRPDWQVEIEQGVKHRASGLADVYVIVV